MIPNKIETREDAVRILRLLPVDAFICFQHDGGWYQFIKEDHRRITYINAHQASHTTRDFDLIGDILFSFKDIYNKGV